MTIQILFICTIIHDGLFQWRFLKKGQIPIGIDDMAKVLKKDMEEGIVEHGTEDLYIFFALAKTALRTVNWKELAEDIIAHKDLFSRDYFKNLK